MTISPLALKAKKVIEAAWLHGPSYDLASQAAFALESAQLLQSPETAAEHAQLLARLTDADRAPSGPKSTPETRLEQYADRPQRGFNCGTEQALYEIAIGLRSVLYDTRLRRDDARAGREDAEQEAERLRASLREACDQIAALESDLGGATARVAELEQQLSVRDRPVDEDPIAFALTNRAVVPAGFCRNESPYGRRCDLTAGHDGDHAMADGAGGHFGWPASDEDATPQVRKLRELLAGQRAAVEDQHDSPLHHDYRIGRDMPEVRP
ncbi:hypothetical protein [Streptomyces cylindrosporus]|uniref:Uncharacterized protein n=1 Tax=Streptomyces cylindrosporus TaxID=2927583 RepID=A0ABS9Y2L2_9ACTN|nr:hypothetical protein [Streptomyces cylindrosporus]MCI3271437.1 hypothetical protein [Streptomyces cylindrosporus]